MYSALFETIYCNQQDIMKTSVIALAVILVGATNAQSTGPTAELRKLQAWCPLDHRLTGLNLGYCNEDKNETEAGDLLEASEHHAAKLLFGGPAKDAKCGLCSFLNHENKCGLTSKGLPLPFEMAMKKDEFASMRRWCLLGKANMDVCINFGSEGAGKAARSQMCKDLKENKFKLDGLRALEFTAGEGESIADIVSALGQQKTYSFLGLGGCIRLLEKNTVLRHVFKKLRPDACAVICVRALDSPDTPVMEIAAEVYKGFVSAGKKVLAHHQSEYNKTNIGQVLNNEKILLNALMGRQKVYASNLTSARRSEMAKAARVSELVANETALRAGMEKYIRKAEEYHKRRAEFVIVHGGKVKLPERGDKDLAHMEIVKMENGTGIEELAKKVEHKVMNATEALKALVHEEPKVVNQTELALARLRAEMNRKFSEEKAKLREKLTKEKDTAVLDANVKLAKYEDSYSAEIDKAKDWSPSTTMLKSQ